VVGAGHQQAQLPGDRILDHHAFPRLDVAADEVAQPRLAAGQLGQAARRLGRDGVRAGLDVHRDRPVRPDELQRDLRVPLVGLHAVRQPDRHEDGAVPLGPQFLGGELAQPAGERAVLPAADAEHETGRRGGPQEVLEEADPPPDLRRRIDARLDAECGHDLLP
jgi:hypothetical protein